MCVTDKSYSGQPLNCYLEDTKEFTAKLFLQGEVTQGNKCINENFSLAVVRITKYLTTPVEFQKVCDSEKTIKARLDLPLAATSATSTPF